MREYIFYVLLVFLPIGALMVKILHDYGLPIRNIAYIVLTSLAIVVTFPISMEKLGVFFAFTVYAVLISLIILYMVKTTGSISLETAGTGAISENTLEVNNPKDQKKDENLVLEIKATDIIEPKIDSVPSVSLQEEEAEKSLETPTAVDEVLAETDKSEDAVEEIISERDKTLVNDDIKLENGIIDDNYYEIKDNNIENEEKVELNDEQSTESNDEVKWVVEAAAAVEVQTMEAENISIELNKEILKDEEVESHSELSEEITSYINEAFFYKTEGNNEKAIEKFLLIWENTKDYDLKYLVTLELVEMYKSEGLYNLAQEILTKSYDEVKEINTSLASQLNKELSYIILLNNEINRLRLDQVPFDKLPRWVKMKVADEINQLD